MGTHNLCFEQKYEKYQSFLPDNFQFLQVKFSIYLNRRIFVMLYRFDGFGPRNTKMCLRAYADNEGPDKPAHPRSLISAFTLRQQNQ